jgi:flavin reductase (DIM6/NTAB) family NADH-FMN oxidoreductase RutF
LIFINGAPPRQVNTLSPAESHHQPWRSSVARAEQRVTMRKRALPLAKVYSLLEPGPVVLLTTVHKERPNVMSMSWHTPLEFEPPLVACVVSDRNHTFGLLRQSRECVINIPTVELAKKVVACGNTSGESTDKFPAFHLTPRTAKRVSPPLIDECYASLECRVVDTRMVPKYGLFAMEVVAAWVAPTVKNPRTLHHRGNGHFMVAGETIKLRSNMK